jgi:hypothetical protein
MLWIINAISVVQLVLLIDVVKRQSHMQRRLANLELGRRRYSDWEIVDRAITRLAAYVMEDQSSVSDDDLNERWDDRYCRICGSVSSAEFWEDTNAYYVHGEEDE